MVQLLRVDIFAIFCFLIAPNRLLIDYKCITSILERYYNIIEPFEGTSGTHMPQKYYILAKNRSRKWLFLLYFSVLLSCK